MKQQHLGDQIWYWRTKKGKRFGFVIWQANIAAKRNEKVAKYRQFTFQLRERRPGYNITIVPVVIGALGGGIKDVLRDVERVFSEHSEPE